MRSIIFGILSSLSTVFLITFLNNFKTYLRLKKFNGIYVGFQTDGVEIKNHLYFFKYNVINLFKIQGQIELREEINETTTWISNIYINNSNPIVCIGSFNYINTDSWGQHQLELGESKKEIFIMAFSCLSNKTYYYRLKKINKY